MSLTVEINGTEQNTQNFTSSNVITSAPDSCSFALPNPTAVPVAGQIISVFRSEDTSTILFAGPIVSVSKQILVKNAVAASREYRYFCRCGDNQIFLNRILINNSFTNQTCFQIIDSMITIFNTTTDGLNLSFTTNNVQTGPIILEKNIPFTRVSDAIRNLAMEVGYSWFVDEDKDIHFFQVEETPTPFNLDETAVTTKVNQFQVTPQYEQIRNSVIVRGSFFPQSAFVQTVVSDGAQRTWNLAFTPTSTNFSMTIDGASKTVSLDNVNPDDGGELFYYSIRDKYVRAGDFGPTVTPTKSSIMEFTYDIQIPVIVKAEDEESKTAIAAVDGSSGLYQTILYDFKITSRDEAKARAKTELAQYKDPEVLGSFSTFEHGFRAGQFFQMTVSGYEDFHGLYQVQRVTLIMRGVILEYFIEFANLRLI